MDPKTVGRWFGAPVRAMIAPITTLVIVIGVVMWFFLFAVEKVTGYQTLPELIAPARRTEQAQIQEDEVWCGVYDALINLKASDNKSKIVEDKILKTGLNHKRVYAKSMCNMLHDMDTLIPPNTARSGVPRRQAWWYKAEFILEGERKRALAGRIRELEKLGYGHKDMKEWEATHYVRPARKRTMGNQTAAEIAGLHKALEPIPKPKVKLPDGKEADDSEGGFQFFKPRR